jgi:hypothetical protein
MSHNHVKISKPILAWLAGNLLGIVFLLAMTSAMPFLTRIRGFVASSLIIFIPIGLTQWLVLRRFFPISLLWIITMPVGFILTFLINSTIPDSLRPYVDDESITTLTILVTAYGTTIGLAQWIVLRRHFPKSFVWILGSSFGLGLGFGIVLVTDLINLSGFISGVIVFLVYGIVTGSILAWLLNQHVRPAMFMSDAL